MGDLALLSGRYTSPSSSVDCLSTVGRSVGLPRCLRSLFFYEGPNFAVGVGAAVVRVRCVERLLTDGWRALCSNDWSGGKRRRWTMEHGEGRPTDAGSERGAIALFGKYGRWEEICAMDAQDACIILPPSILPRFPLYIIRAAQIRGYVLLLISIGPKPSADMSRLWYRIFNPTSGILRGRIFGSTE